MGNPYTSVTVTSYNSNPPADDGSEVAANRVQWSTHKTKIGDPLKTAIESINTNTNTAFAKLVGGGGVTSTATDYTVVAGDQGKLVKVTASATITTPDATVVTSPFVFGILNLHTSAITLDGSGSQTINGASSIQVGAGEGYLVWTDGSNWFVVGRKTGVLGRGYIDGCILSNGTDATNDINIAAGVCRDSTNAVDITVPAISGKQLDANWAAGGSAGMRNSAAGIANTTYHIWAVRTAASETADIYAHTSATAATVLAALQAESGGSSYAYLRRIGSIIREGGAIVAFTQRGDYFGITTPTLEVDTSITTSASSHVLRVPTGIEVLAKFNMMVNNGGRAHILASELTQTVASSSSTAAPLGSATSDGDHMVHGPVELFTNTSGQIRAFSTISSTTFRTSTFGWTDSRGKDS